MRARTQLMWVLTALLAVTACTSTAAPSASEAHSAAPSTGSAPAANRLPDCEPIELRSPTGQLIDLNGPWIEVGSAGELMTWWIVTEGDCVWGAGQVDDVPMDRSIAAVPDLVQSLAGRIESDLAITGEILLLGPLPIARFPPERYSPLRMLIEFDDAGAILLREDRQPGVRGPRCPDPGGYCPDPLVLQPVD